MKPGTFASSLSAGFLALLIPASAFAQASDAAATALFDEGRKLMTQHRYADACPKLAESQRLAPSGGTLLNLAECYEHAGQSASAWAAWKDAAARANAAGKTDVERKAVARAAALETALARLTIAVPSESDVAGLEVKRDGIVVGRAEYGSAIPVDPGVHVIEARAPGKVPWTTNTEVAAKQADAKVTVAMADAPAPAPPSPVATPQANRPATLESSATPEQPASTTGSTQRAIGIATLGVGVAGVAVGTVFGLVAISKNNEALQPKNCSTSTKCFAPGLSLTSDAKDAATVSTIGFAAGAAAVVGGAVLWLTAPAARTTSIGIRVVPVVAPAYGGVSVASVW